jgi:hypothetical protein
MVSANRLQKQNVELRNSGILRVLTAVTSWVFEGGRTYALRELSEAYGCEFAWENEVLTCSKDPPVKVSKDSQSSGGKSAFALFKPLITEIVVR